MKKLLAVSVLLFLLLFVFSVPVLCTVPGWEEGETSTAVAAVKAVIPGSRGGSIITTNGWSDSGPWWW